MDIVHLEGDPASGGPYRRAITITIAFESSGNKMSTSNGQLFSSACFFFFLLFSLRLATSVDKRRQLNTYTEEAGREEGSEVVRTTLVSFVSFLVLVTLLTSLALSFLRTRDAITRESDPSISYCSALRPSAI